MHWAASVFRLHSTFRQGASIRMNRRVFVQSGMASAAAAATPGKIRAAFYGTRHSHFGGKWKAVSDNPAYELVGVCEPDSEWRAKVKVTTKWLTEQELLSD